MWSADPVIPARRLCKPSRPGYGPLFRRIPQCGMPQCNRSSANRSHRHELYAFRQHTLRSVLSPQALEPVTGDAVVNGPCDWSRYPSSPASCINQCLGRPGSSHKSSAAYAACVAELTSSAASRTMQSTAWRVSCAWRSDTKSHGGTRAAPW
jgi:hypothetical protein